MIRKYSPEKNPERFQEIREAYERLTEEKDKPENNIQLEFPADNKLATQMFDQIQQLMQEQDYERAALTAKEGMKYYHDVECFFVYVLQDVVFWMERRERQSSAMKSW